MDIVFEISYKCTERCEAKVRKDYQPLIYNVLRLVVLESPVFYAYTMKFVNLYEIVQENTKILQELFRLN